MFFCAMTAGQEEFDAITRTYYRGAGKSKLDIAASFSQGKAANFPMQQSAITTEQELL